MKIVSNIPQAHPPLLITTRLLDFGVAGWQVVVTAASVEDIVRQRKVLQPILRGLHRANRGINTLEEEATKETLWRDTMET